VRKTDIIIRVSVPDGWERIKTGDLEKEDMYFSTYFYGWSKIPEDWIGKEIKESFAIIRRIKIPEGWKRIKTGEKLIHGDRYWSELSRLWINVVIYPEPDNHVKEDEFCIRKK